MGGQQSQQEKGGGQWSFSYEGHNPVFDDRWSKLSREVVVDKIRGLVYGQAIGDALGLATEFMSKQQAEACYGTAGPQSFIDTVQDGHRNRWKCGDWTDDTDQMILLMVSMATNQGRAIPSDFARRILSWKKHGFQELGDFGGMGIGMTTLRVLSSTKFLENPHQTADDVWQATGRYLAANGAVMRTSICGAANFHNLENVFWQSREFCLVTHADPRCVASCAVVSIVIATMLQGECGDLNTKKEVEELVKSSAMLAEKALEGYPGYIKEFYKHLKVKSWEALQLDDEAKIGYTFKAMGAGIYALRCMKDFRTAITELVMEAGDADSNASVAGGILGCKVGYSGLPKDLVGSLVYHDWLDNLVNKFLAMMGLDGVARIAPAPSAQPTGERPKNVKQGPDSAAQPAGDEATPATTGDEAPTTEGAEDEATPATTGDEAPTTDDAEDEATPATAGDEAPADTGETIPAVDKESEAETPAESDAGDQGAKPSADDNAEEAKPTDGPADATEPQPSVDTGDGTGASKADDLPCPADDVVMENEAPTQADSQDDSKEEEKEEPAADSTPSTQGEAIPDATEEAPATDDGAGKDTSAGDNAAAQKDVDMDAEEATPAGNTDAKPDAQPADGDTGGDEPMDT